MGCDIYLFVEYDLSSEEGVRSFSRGSIVTPRHYALYSALTGVRPGLHDPEPLFKPRGLPSTCSEEVIEAFFSLIMEVGEEPPCWWRGSITNRAHAEECVRDGDCFYRDHWETPRALVSHTEYHHPSWLYRSEIWEALGQHGILADELSPHMRGVLAVMQELEGWFGATGVRLVMWFHG
jgi:hypothetical protein